MGLGTCFPCKLPRHEYCTLPSVKTASRDHCAKISNMASKPVLALLCCAVVLALSFGTATADEALAAAQVQTVLQPAQLQPGLVQPAVVLPAQKRILPVSVTLNWPHASIVVGVKFLNYLEQLLEAAKSRDLNAAKTVQQQLFAVTNPAQQAAAQAPKHRRHLSTYVVSTCFVWLSQGTLTWHKHMFLICSAKAC